MSGGREAHRGLLIGLLFLALGLGTVGMVYFNQRSQQTANSPRVGSAAAQSTDSQDPAASSISSSNLDTAKSQTSSSTDAPSGNTSTKAGGSPSKQSDSKQAGTPTPLDYGRIQAVKGGSNAQTASVLEALKTGRYPERISAMLPPREPFDRKAFESDPQKFCSEIVPGRVFLTAQPSPQVPVLEAVGERMIRTRQDEPVKLVVKGAPGAPISLTSFDAGTFCESKLNNVTVQADQDGKATVTFVAGSGVTEDVNILAGSPLSSGQVKFKILVETTRWDPLGAANR